MAKIITISREFGSGGRELGKRLADLLGYEFYDKEIISKVAQKQRLDEEYVEKNISYNSIKSVPLTYGRSFKLSNSSQNIQTNLMVEEKQVLLDIAKSNNNCIIVGRNADIILNEYNPLTIFVCSNLESKIERCKKRMTEDEKKSIKSIEHEIKQIDKMRIKTREILTDGKWGDKSQYHLIVNTAEWDLGELALALVEYIKRWFKD